MGYLVLKNIKKSFSKIKVLNDVSIDIKKGEFVCFLGPSGCGKTTLLRIIAGLEKEDNGCIELEGKDIVNLSTAERNIGIVFQNYALFPNLTIFNNIAYGLVNMKLPKSEIETRVMDMLEMINMVDIRDKYPTQISGGQQQRVALARSLVLKPDILLLDEPLSALDAKVRESLRSEIKRIQKELNITTIMVTHDQEEAITMGDRIVLFNEGNIAQCGKPEDIYYKPNNEFVADFIGKTNFLKKENGVIDFVRPECIYFSDKKEEDLNEARVKILEFRGNMYRALVENRKSKKELYIDISWKEKVDMDIEVGKNIFYKI